MGVVYLIRHGQASFGASDYDALSALGHRQARVVGEALRARGVAPSVLVSGGMKRHKETVAGCLATLGEGFRCEEDLDWNEYDHEEILGALDPRLSTRAGVAAQVLREGNPRKAFQALFEEALDRWIGGMHDDDYTETWTAFRARVLGALERVVARVGRSETALVFTSGGPIGCVTQGMLELSGHGAAKVSATLANASLTKLIIGRSGVRLSSLNEHGFLEAFSRDLITYR